MIVLGGLPLTIDVIHLLEIHPDVEIVGVVSKPVHSTSCSNKQSAYEYCIEKGLKILSLNDVLNLDNLHLAISARNSDILSSIFISKFKVGIVNCHGGYLPEYRGVGGHIFPIINQESYSGASIHFMSPEVDRGDLIDRKKVSIRENDTGFSLYNKINSALLELLENNMRVLLNNECTRYDQSLLPLNSDLVQNKFYFKKDIQNLMDGVSSQECKKIIARALYWPGKKKPKFLYSHDNESQEFFEDHSRVFES